MNVKLITSANSPFGARITIAARVKKIDLELCPPPGGGLRSPAFLAINPIAKIPVLITDQGQEVAESAVILRYLDQRFPDPPLRPVDPEAAARIDLLAHIADTYVMAPVIRLFPHLNPLTRDQQVVEAELARWRDGVAVLSHFLGDGSPPSGEAVTLADCVLPPTLHLGTRIAAMLDLPHDPARMHAPLVAYYARIRRHPVIGPVLSALTQAQADYDIKAGRPSLADRH